MGLIIPRGASWAYCSHNMPSTPSSNVGTQVTAGTSNTDSTAVTLLTALTHDVEFMRISIAGQTITTAQDNNSLFSILVDPSGGTSWSTLIPYLIAAPVATTTTVPHAGIIYEFPLWVPAGSSIGCFARCAEAASTPVTRVLIEALGGNRNPASWWSGQRVTAIGIDSTNSRGTSHTPGNAGSLSTWTNFGSALTADCGAIQWGAGGNFASNTWTNNSYRMEFGVGSVMIGPPVAHATNSSESYWNISTGVIFARLAAGTQFMCRGTCDGAASAQNVAAYAVH